MDPLAEIKLISMFFGILQMLACLCMLIFLKRNPQIFSERAKKEEREAGKKACLIFLGFTLYLISGFILFLLNSGGSNPFSTIYVLVLVGIITLTLIDRNKR